MNDLIAIPLLSSLQPTHARAARVFQFSPKIKLAVQNKITFGCMYVVY